jgi:hypothetical protein
MYVFYEMGDCKNYEFFPSIRDVCPETRHVNVSWVVCTSMWIKYW